MIFILRLMAKPDKPVFIPERRVDRDVNKAPEFNHNIMGRRVEDIMIIDQASEIILTF